MKKILAIIALSVLSFTSVEGAAVTVTNYDEATGAQIGITSASGAAILTAGVVQSGFFAAAPTDLIAALNGTQPSYDALLSAFTAFGTSNTIGESYSGLFESVKQGNIGNADTIVGKSIYTLIGNGTTLANSTEVAILVDSQTYNFDNPVFAARSDLASATVTSLFGSKTGPSVTTALGATTASIQLAPVTVIPEPMSAAFLLSSLAFVVRRRRA